MAQIPDLHALAAAQGRYDVEAFCFVSQGLRHAAKLYRKEKRTGESRHLTAAELVEGVIDLAAERFGLLAGPVLQQWGVRGSEDVGNITFTLIDNKVFAKQPSDRLEDFLGGPVFAELLTERVRARLLTGTPS